MIIEIISIGSELLIGDILNTNTQHISKVLSEKGFNVYYHTTVGDNYDRLEEVIEHALKRSDLVITTGGLGPTNDDITKEVVSKVFNKKLIVNKHYYEKIESKYRERGKQVSKGSEKEASIIENSIILDNNVGLAPGFYYENDISKIAVLPGPPKEMEDVFNFLLNNILSKYIKEEITFKTLIIKGIPEGTLNDELHDLIENNNPTLAPYAKNGEVHLRIGAKGITLEERENMIKSVENELILRYKDKIINI